MRKCLKKFTVSVEKTIYTTGAVTVRAVSSDAALEQVKKKISTCKLQTTDIFWGDHHYQDGSFQTTGDVCEEN